MTVATQVLRKEHDAILSMLDATDEVARRLYAGERVEPKTLDGLVEFFRLFADRCHHGKEEDLLFRLLEKKGMPVAGGPIGVMLQEHEQGRSLTRQMADAATEYRKGASAAGAGWAEAARHYVPLLRGHIAKENDILFVLADRMLSPEEQDTLAGDFERIELEKMGAGTHERLHAQMDQLRADIWKTRAG